MGLRYENLDAETRKLMQEEVAADVSNGSIYLSSYLSEYGRLHWPIHLEEAIVKMGNDDTLADALRRNPCYKAKTERRNPKGGYTLVSVPVTAAQTLAKSQFNMYYMRALARQAIQQSRKLVVYRAKQVDVPRRESELMIGTDLDANEVLTVLRQTHGVEPSTNIPMPNTGITVRLV